MTIASTAPDWSATAAVSLVPAINKSAIQVPHRHQPFADRVPHDTPSPAITRLVIKLTPPGLNVPIELVPDDIDWARLMMALDDAAAAQTIKLHCPLPS